MFHLIYFVAYYYIIFNMFIKLNDIFKLKWDKDMGYDLGYTKGFSRVKSGLKSG